MTRCPASCWLVNAGASHGRVLAAARRPGSPVTPTRPTPAIEARNPRRVGRPSYPDLPVPDPPVLGSVMVNSLPRAVGGPPTVPIHYRCRGGHQPEARAHRPESFRPGLLTGLYRAGPHPAGAPGSRAVAARPHAVFLTCPK